MSAEACCHADTAPITPNRRRAAIAHAPITSTASANTDPAGSNAAARQSSSTSSPVHSARTASAFPAKARSQPRTVDAGRPSRAAIGRCPCPRALARNAAPITSTASARRTRHETANSTCVTRQPKHRTRRGRSRPTPRTVRGRA